MMQVLQYIAQHDNELNFISMLPLAGYDGSLQYRAACIRLAWTEKSQQKPALCRGYITWRDSLPQRAGNEWRLYNIFLAMR